MLKKLVYLILVLTAISCIDPFDIDIDNNEAGGELVVEGIITNEQKVHRIRLSRVGSVQGLSGYPLESGASVAIKDDLENCYQLQETQNGVYVTDTSEFKTEVGRAYQLKIVLASGVEYESNLQVLKPISDIDRLWARGERESSLAGSQLVESENLNIYTNVNRSENEDFVRFDYSGVYEFKSAYQGSSICWGPDDVIPEEILPLADTTTCFLSQDVALPLNIFSFTNIQMNENFNQKIISIPSSRVFYFGYSMVVRKYSLTEEFYNYLEDIAEQSNFGGDLFAPPPTAVRGNIQQVGDSERFALGFFTTSSMASKRIFIDNFVLRDEIRDPFNFEDCDADISSNIEIFNMRPPESCCDCRLLQGATNRKPEFWPN